MTRPVSMAAKVEAYLAFRRGLGYRLWIEGRLLQQFARYADAAGHRGPLTTDLAVRWARATASTDRLYPARRLEVVRCLARHLAATEPGTEVPPRRQLAPAHRRPRPDIYSAADVAALMAAAGRLGPPGGLRPDTYRTLIGLLAAAGLRISEALHLGRRDADLEGGLLSVRRTKFRKSRLVPLHPTAADALRAYAGHRARAVPADRCDRFFVSGRGLGLPTRRSGVFRKLL